MINSSKWFQGLSSNKLSMVYVRGLHNHRIKTMINDCASWLRLVSFREPSVYTRLIRTCLFVVFWATWEAYRGNIFIQNGNPYGFVHVSWLLFLSLKPRNESKPFYWCRRDPRACWGMNARLFFGHLKKTTEIRNVNTSGRGSMGRSSNW